MMPARLRRSLTAKLVSGQLLVIVTGSVTLLLVALAIGPGLFRRHVREALGYVPADVARHLDTAFDEATLVALAIAVGAALVAAGAIGWLISVRVVRPVRRMAVAAQRFARGSYGSRIPVAGSDELAVLAGAFNEMADSLESAEQRRRELLSDLAHELRTPLATIEGYVEGLADGVIPAGADAWEALETEGRRLRRLVDDLQKVSRAEERQLDLRLVPTAPAALVEQAVHAAAPAYASKGVLVQAAAEERLPAVPADPDRLAEVLANLLENALRHTPSGGTVTASARRLGDQVELAVEDTGEGIAAEHLERIFERFYRADRARSRATGGSGIGLTIARAVVEAHGGRLEATSDGPGRGARFAVRLPVAAPVTGTA